MKETALSHSLYMLFALVHSMSGSASIEDATTAFSSQNINLEGKLPEGVSAAALARSTLYVDVSGANDSDLLRRNFNQFEIDMVPKCTLYEGSTIMPCKFGS